MPKREMGESRVHAPKKRYLDQSWKEELRKAQELEKEMEKNGQSKTS